MDASGREVGLTEAFTVESCVQPPSGIAAWWPFDETSGSIHPTLVALTLECTLELQSKRRERFAVPTVQRWPVCWGCSVNGSVGVGYQDFTIEVLGKFYCTWGRLDRSSKPHIYRE